MNEYDEIRDLIANSSGFVEFADYGDGVSDEWILKAELRLGFKLPESYKWWLRNYGGGEIYGEEIFSIYEQDFDVVVGGDIVYNYELNVKNNYYHKNIMVVCELDDVVFYFDLSQRTNENECPVYYKGFNSEKYADDFISFLKKRILE